MSRVPPVGTRSRRLKVCETRVVRVLRGGRPFLNDPLHSSRLGFFGLFLQSWPFPARVKAREWNRFQPTDGCRGTYPRSRQKPERSVINEKAKLTLAVIAAAGCIRARLWTYRDL
jgi:hypothetical protein